MQCGSTRLFRSVNIPRYIEYYNTITELNPIYLLLHDRISAFLFFLFYKEWGKAYAVLVKMSKLEKQNLFLPVMLFRLKLFSNGQGRNLLVSVKGIRSEVVPRETNHRQIRYLAMFILGNLLQMPVCKQILINDLKKYLLLDGAHFPMLSLFPLDKEVSSSIDISHPYQGNFTYIGKEHIKSGNVHPCIQHVAMLDDHEDEIWALTFALGASLLATASKQGKILVYSLRNKNPKVIARLIGHDSMVESIYWNCDATVLVACGGIKRSFSVWDTRFMSGDERFESEKFKKVKDVNKAFDLEGHLSKVLSICWIPHNSKVFLSSDARGNVFRWFLPNLVKEGVDVKKLQNISKYQRGLYTIIFSNLLVYDMMVTNDRIYFVILTVRNIISVFLFEDISSGKFTSRSLSSKAVSKIHIDVTYDISSVSLASDGCHVLVNCSPNRSLYDFGSTVAIQVWNLKNAEFAKMYKYKNKKHACFVAQSAFCGIAQQFVVGGDERGNIHIWQRNNGKLIKTFQGHFGAISCVIVSPMNKNLFISGGDDKIVRVWRMC